MMNENKSTIVAIIKKGRKFQIINEDGCVAVLTPFSVAKYGLKIGNTYTKKEFAALLLEAEKTDCFERLTSTLTRTVVTEKVAARKLREAGFGKNAISYAIEKAKENYLIDDKRYAENHAEISKATKGAFRIKADLKEKGISEEIIAAVLPDEDEQINALVVQMRKYAKEDMTEKERNRLISRMLYRGYSYGQIKKAMAALFISTDGLE